MTPPASSLCRFPRRPSLPIDPSLVRATLCAYKHITRLPRLSDRPAYGGTRPSPLHQFRGVDGGGVGAAHLDSSRGASQLIRDGCLFVCASRGTHRSVRAIPLARDLAGVAWRRRSAATAARDDVCLKLITFLLLQITVGLVSSFVQSLGALKFASLSSRTSC